MAGGTWDKLEQVFEDRVARALSKLGVHTQADVERLSKRVEALSEAVNELIKSGGAPARKRPVAKRRPRKQATDQASAPETTESAPRKRARKRATD